MPKRTLFLVFFFLFSFIPSLHADSISIPVMVGQTGASAVFGKNELAGYTLAVEEWNARGGVRGSPVTMSIEDTQTNQQNIVTAFHRLGITKPPVIMGPTWLDGFQAIIPLARTKNILLVTPSAAIEAFERDNRGWPISFYYNSTREIAKLIEGINERGFKRVAVLYEQEPFAEFIRGLVLKTYPSPTADIGVSAGTTSYQSIITKLKSSNTDLILLFVWNEQSLLNFLQQLRVQAPTIALATVHDGEGWLSNPVFKQVLPRLIHTKFLLSDKSFAPRFAKRFGYEPILTASNAYDAMNSVLTAMNEGYQDANSIRNYLNTSFLKSATFDTFAFEDDGSVPSNVEIIDRKQSVTAP
jgi:branched-chain amino acid transport system substrate-binding protein